MLRITLQNLLARKYRLISTAVSVVIGVAFLSGSLVLIDTIQRTFDDLFASVNEDVDAQVRSADVIETDFGDLRGRIDESLLAQVLDIDGVAAADGAVFGYAQLVTADGETLAGGQGPPALGFAWTDVDELNPMVLSDGSRAPVAPNEVVIDAKSAKDGSFAVGDTVTILLQGPPQEFTIVGVARFGTADSPLGASLALFERDTAQEILGEPGKFDSIDVVADSEVSQEDLRARIDDALGPEVEVITGAALIEESQNEVADALSFFNTFMVIFAAIALFVASFIIYNTFSILVAQRTREMALLRALGARRHQLLLGVVLEAVVVGVIASFVGLGAGVVVANALKALLEATGISIPAGDTVFTISTVQLSLAVGVGVTVLAALAPSWRASGIAPMAAIRSVAVDESGRSGRRALAGLGVMAVGLGLLLWGLFGSSSQLALTLGGGAALIFVGLAWLGPIVALPFTRIVGWPLDRLRGVPGELARENAMRNPRRTSTTAAALMIGVGLVGTISIFAASAKASIAKVIDDSFVGDRVDVTFAATGTQTLTVSVLYERDELTGNFFIGNPAYEANYPDLFDFQVYVLRAAGVSVDDALAAVEAVAADYPNADVQDLEGFKQAQADQINQLLNLVYVLLALAIVIALIGIANTLALSILERTNELGLLRAVGMTRSQLRSSIRWESVLIALLGTSLGAVVGLFFGWVLVRALEDEGFTELRLPAGQLVGFLVVAVLAGILAAAQPARRAAKLDVLDAIASD